MLAILNYLTPDPLPTTANRGHAWLVAGELYDRLVRQARWARIRAGLTRRPDCLLSLVALEAQGAVARGPVAVLQTIPVDKIRGSEGRLADFDGHFRPRHAGLRNRWQSVAQAYALGIPLPPIEVIQVGDTYYVRDGHHRVSLARVVGQREMEAYVTVWEPAGTPAARLRGAPVAARRLAMECGSP